MNVVAIKDMKAQQFLQPYVCKNIAEATRNFEIISNEGESMISKFPADFRLFHLGSVDLTHGTLIPLDHVVDLGSALDYKRKPAQDVPMNFEPKVV